MLIDSHVHFWQYNPETYSWIPGEMAAIRKDFLPPDLKPFLEKNGFGGCIAVQADQSEEETARLLNFAEKFGFIKGVVGWIDLSSENVETRLEMYSKNPFLKGIRHTVWDEKGEFMLTPDFQTGISALKDFNLIYEILSFDYQLASAVELARNFPNQKFLLDHLGKPKVSQAVSAEWKKNIQELGELPNVYCKLSGLVTEAINFNWQAADLSAFFDVAVEAFGTKRLLFGSDWPVCLAAASYEEVVTTVENYFTSYSKDEKKDIFGRNAAGFYNHSK